jgi:hypothetical protein
LPEISALNGTPIDSVAEFDGLTVTFTGLLDTYGSAAAAYSVRRLYSLYTGDCMRVRRSSDNLEQDIPFDSNGELSTTAIATFCGASDGFVRAWYDQSQSGGTGVGNDAVQPGAGTQPKIYDGTTGIIENGTTTLRPSLQWFATASAGNQLYSTGLGTGNTRYFSYVAQATDVAGGGSGGYQNYIILTAQYGGSSPGNFLQVYTFNSTNSIIVNYPTNALDMSSTTATNVQHILSVQKTSTDSELWINGTSQDTSTGTQNLEDELSIGWFYVAFARMKFQELIIWNSDQDGAGNRTGIESNMSSYFGV